ncbi:MAG: S1 RNA-binding domain-containing protein [Leptospiraceae bacterium]|nr:S1 RNA-binding domain-containing protein [Leptospiraceae bacterium]MDW8305953.1 S1 RNA-binding domain-containing protein [Leptospiraceae bacterium]
MPIKFLEESHLTMEDLLKEENLPQNEIRLHSEVTGRVVGISENYVIVDLGSKSEGRIPLREFPEPPKTGDIVEAIVKGFDKETGFINLSKRELEIRKGWEIVKEAYENQLSVSGTIKRSMKHGYLVHVEGLAMFLPHSQVGSLGPARRGQKPQIVGQTFSFRILEINPKKKTGVLSRKLFQDEQNEARWKELAQNVKIGDIVTGKVTRHSKAGVFLSVHGVEGFLHRSNISWEKKVENFRERLPLGKELQVRVLEIIPEEHRLSLGLKQLTADPWTTVMERFKVGDIVQGKVTFLARYGAFVDLGDGLEGLIHTSEMSWTKKINHARDVLKLNQIVEVKILGINPVDKRIALGLRQLQTNPWEELKQVLQVGQKRKGKIREITNFGIFVSITDEIDGLVRKEDVRWEDTSPDLKKLYKVNDEVEFQIISLDFENKRIECSIRHCLPNPYVELRNKYPRGSVIEGKVSGIVDFGIFVTFDNGFEGLVHTSAMSKEQAQNHKKHFKKGDPIKAVVRSIEPENRRISLSLKDVDYALEQMEIRQYVEKDTRQSTLTHSPFARLREIYPEK